jgi:three-Cys-motif partner protein
MAAALPTLPIFEKWKDDPHLKKEQNTVYGYVNIINHLGRMIEACHPTPANYESFQPHVVTYLKLLLVCSYARQCFLPIGLAATPQVVYLDVLSASGLSVTKEAPKDPIAGSCFLTPLAWQDFAALGTAPTRAFATVHTFDYEPANLNLLRARRDALVSIAGMKLPIFHYHSGDANKSVPALVAGEAQRNATVKDVSKRPLYLAFVDNQALDVTMATIEALQGNKDFRADLIVHLPTSSIWRAVQSANANDKAEQHKLNAFFGSEVWRDIKTPDDIPAVYHKVVWDVTVATGDNFQELPPVRIKGGKTEFALCFYVRQTKNLKDPRGWLDIIGKQATACNDIDESKIQGILARSLKGQKSLFGF